MMIVVDFCSTSLYGGISLQKKSHFCSAVYVEGCEWTAS
nr:MAG TPA: hypothetical protein [Bacteriophage sp.]